ncbi:MAG: 30S ribosomal protein S12 methylthiotransferase RimO [Clostridia bacterium]|nr:30S ribosomal protein S12 methylthiotransferase RimO [Clostridia bacterium]
MLNVGFISLGCSKNLIDTEMAIGLFKKQNFSIVNDVKKANIIVVNTCGFIESAKQEAIDTILEMAEYKQNGICKYLIVMGCLVQRYKKDLEKALPEVDLFISIDEYNKFSEKIENLLNSKQDYRELNYFDRVITTGNKFAYLKIAEGCSNKCTYCAIPYIRGPFNSRKMEDIIEEAEELAKKGIEEIIIIAQDTTKYGTDLYGKPMLAELLRNLCYINKFKWIRFLYAYPESITDELINVVKENKQICNYFDIPIQHISNSVLKRMNRKTKEEDIKNLIKKIRKEIPDAILRTSLIVGFPGETEEDYRKLYDFVKEIKFDKLGTFMYSKEDGTPAEKLDNQIHYQTKKKRYNEIMKLSSKISRENLETKLGKEFEVLIESKTFDNKYYVGRSYMDIPETDGVVFVKNETKDELLDKFVNIKIKDIENYDLVGEVK